MLELSNLRPRLKSFNTCYCYTIPSALLYTSLKLVGSFPAVMSKSNIGRSPRLKLSAATGASTPELSAVYAAGESTTGSTGKASQSPTAEDSVAPKRSSSRRPSALKQDVRQVWELCDVKTKLADLCVGSQRRCASSPTLVVFSQRHMASNQPKRGRDRQSSA